MQIRIKETKVVVSVVICTIMPNSASTRRIHLIVPPIAILLAIGSPSSPPIISPPVISPPAPPATTDPLPTLPKLPQ